MPSIGFGSNGYLKFDYEDTWGTVPGTPDGKKIAFISESIRGSKTLIQNESLSGDPNPRDPIISREDCAGDIVYQVGIDSVPAITKWICSDLSTSGAGDPYTHTSKLQAGTAQSICLESFLDLDTDLWKYGAGLIVESVSGEIGPDGFFRWTIGVTGKAVSKASASFDADSTKDWTAETQIHHGLIAAADCKLGGTWPAAATATTRLISLSFSLNLNPNKDIYGVGQAGARLGLGRGRASLTGTARFYIDDSTFWDLANAGTYTSMDMTWKAASTPNRWFQMQFPKILLSKTDPAITNDGPIACDFNFIGSKDSTAETAIVFVTQNANAGTTYA